ncbi:MAG: hypothetical protein JST54_30425 [Deltaproteobacteria bacterium]|nr:hypothetical protein [Deltaproteobacteria bacterium]
MKRLVLAVAVLLAGCNGSSSSSSSGSSGHGSSGAASTGGTGASSGTGSTASSSSGSTGSSAASTASSSSTASGGSSGSSGTSGSCTEITLGTWQAAAENATGGAAPTAFQALASPDLGADGVPDVAQIELYTDDVDTFDLSQYPNDNDATCEQCVRLFQDLRADGGLARQFFQSRGTFAITAADSVAGLLEGSLSDVTLVEVTVDPTTSVSEPVPGGSCLHIASSSVNVVPPGTTSASSSSASASAAASSSGSTSGSSSSGSGSGSGSGSTSSSASGSGSDSTASSDSGSGSGSGSTASSASSSGSGSTASGSGSGSTG